MSVNICVSSLIYFVHLLARCVLGYQKSLRGYFLGSGKAKKKILYKLIVIASLCCFSLGKVLLRTLLDRGHWVAHLVKCLPLDFGSDHDHQGHEIEPCIGLSAKCGGYLSFSLPLPHSLPAPACSQSLSLSKTKLQQKKPKNPTLG